MPECAVIRRPLSSEPSGTSDRPTCRVAYIVSRFPQLTQTFVLFEMLAVEETGVSVELFPLLRGKDQTKHADGASIWKKLLEYWRASGSPGVMHPEAEAMSCRAHYQPFLSTGILLAQLYYLWAHPKAYLSALWTLLAGSWGNANFLVGGLAVFPKSVYLARRMRQMGITHIHAHFANHPTTAALIIHRLTEIPYSFTAHGSDLHRHQELLREKVAEAAFAIPISEYNRRVMLEHSDPDRASRLPVIHCGVDTQQFVPQRVPQPAGSSVFRILSIGTLHEVKGQSHLIDACQRLKLHGLRFECHLVGEGPDRDMLQRRIEDAGMIPEVRLLGQKSRREVMSLLRQADVFVTPSVPSRSGRREGIPVVLMEAMATGLAVVASDLSGIPELVEDEVSGLLTPPGDAARLAASLMRLHEDANLRHDLGTEAREKVIREFDQRNNAARLAELFLQSSRS